MTILHTTSPKPTSPQPTSPVAVLLAHAAGYVAHRTVTLGLRRGLIGALARSEAPLSPDELAEQLRFDPFYVAVWCRAAQACGLCERTGEATTDAGAALGGRYLLTSGMAEALLDTGHPGYVGAVFPVLEQAEVFDRFDANLDSGERLWWDGCSAEWIHGVADTGTPFYTRLVANGLNRIPLLAERLTAGCRVVDTACGSGVGLTALAHAFPNCEIVGVDGDRSSLAEAESRLADCGLTGRCRLVHSPLEELTLDAPAACVINNISMHECRDIDRVTVNVRAALEPGGWFVISDFPFPDTAAGLRTVPGRVMTGIQYFEAQIDDQLLPRSAYDDLLARHGFTDIDHFELSPVHAVTHGRAPR